MRSYSMHFNLFRPRHCWRMPWILHKGPERKVFQYVVPISIMQCAWISPLTPTSMTWVVADFHSIVPTSHTAPFCFLFRTGSPACSCSQLC